ncbi:MAG TPA: serine hydrolase domain-containing protein [Chitinophaga sp.]|uniref:serine hydrolase domain-containing protein n=1 Tax=Chitinophaga sp. TaxID=1869181 RepID=UPI002C972EB6|nr:serine hydrolase domain-containing protein [Chitinophaga sp.]HVI47162.1 serine hydrolase domain-containing protein [Chitinophaga sp.]
MKYMSSLILLILIISADPLSAQKKPFTDSISTLMARTNVPLLGLGIIESGKIKSVRLYGALNGQTPPPLNTLFNVASLTKPITAMVALKLANSGNLDLDEPLYHYWIDPDIKDDPRHLRLTTRIILSHRTGFPNWRDKQLAFRFDPGTGYGYSGEGFEYLRRALEAKFKTTLQHLADSLIFKPLNMQHTQYAWDSRLDTSLFAQPCDSNGNRIYNAMHLEPNAADWLVTTLEDYTKFGVYMLQGGGLSPLLFSAMTTPVSAITPGGNEAMGLGWGILSNLPNREYILMHTGHDPGVSTLIFLLPQSQRGVIILTNADNGMKAMIPILRAQLEMPDLGK